MNADPVRDMWAAADSLTKPTHVRVPRQTHDTPWLEQLADDPSTLACNVAKYRAATSTWARVPSLWEQATWALTTGSETSAGGSSPLASRSPADLALMGMMLTIRETVTDNLHVQRQIPHDTVPRRIRQLAVHTATHRPHHVPWWGHRFTSWARQMGVYLRAVDAGPRPLRLRSRCPVCLASLVTVDSDTGLVTAFPILIDFEAGLVRAATCQACGRVWWAGADLWELERLILDDDLRPAG